MTNDAEKKNPSRHPHKWRFFRSGGFDQVRLERGADLLALTSSIQSYGQRLAVRLTACTWMTKHWN